MIMSECPKYILEINDRFNRQLRLFSAEDANRIAFILGNPSAELLAGGVINKPIKLYGNKTIKKLNKHGFSLGDLYNLPLVLRSPIAVFNNYDTDNNRSVLTELKAKKGNFLVSIELGKGTDAVFDIITSTFGKDSSAVSKWISQNKMTYINKEKAFGYLYHSALIAGAPDNESLIHIAKIIKDFQNPKIPKENFERISDIKLWIDNQGSYLMKCNIDGQPQLSVRLSNNDARDIKWAKVDKMEMAEKYFSQALSSKRSVGISMKR